MVKLVNRPSSLSVRRFYEQRNKILIIRDTGGAGDILMHRMIFEDMKKANPECEIHFACPPQFHSLVEDHPYIDQVLDSKKLRPKEYNVSHNTTSACVRYEIKTSPRVDLHRSDIWAAYCGLKLQNHSMNFRLTEEEKNWGKAYFRSLNPDPSKPNAVICPISSEIRRNMTCDLIEAAVEALRQQNAFVVGIHNQLVPRLLKLNVPLMMRLNHKQWMAVMSAADYCVSVDTSHFHLAGGMGVPLTGIFTNADGKVYGKYFDFELVQKHRDNGDWDCGPCYDWSRCTKVGNQVEAKPCLTEMTTGMVIDGVGRMFDRWPTKDRKKMVLPVIR